MVRVLPIGAAGALRRLLKLAGLRWPPPPWPFPGPRLRRPLTTRPIARPRAARATTPARGRRNVRAALAPSRGGCAPRGGLADRRRLRDARRGWPPRGCRADRRAR